MATKHTNYNPVLPHCFRSIPGLGLPAITLLDVGASGGIEQHWLPLGEQLHAIGFDIITQEVDRLNAENKNPRVKYENYFVGYEKFEELFPRALSDDAIACKNNDPQKRTSYERAWKAMNLNYADTYFNKSGEKSAITDKRISLDAYVKEKGIEHVDFIKIDTDGHDYEVLLGAQEILKKSVLGVAIEVPLHGPVHPHANVFCNIDRLLRELGFSIYVLDTYPCSKGAMPAQFTYRLPAQTVKGQILWGDAVYFRDAGDEAYAKKWNMELSRERLHALCCLYEIVGVADCAAEVILRLRETTGLHTEYTTLLDVLTRTFVGATLNYENFIKAFEEDPTRLYPPK